MAFKTMEELKEEAAKDKLVVVTLQELREALNYKKLGPRVLAEVAQKLSGQGLGFFPTAVILQNELPRGWDTVRIYQKDSTIGRLIQAVLEPTESGDTYLLEVTEEGDTSAAELLDQIRTIIGD